MFVNESVVDISIFISGQLHSRTHLDGDWTMLKAKNDEAITHRSAAIFGDRPATVPEEKHQVVVFVVSMEHHSNLLPWRESTALVIEIKSLASGLVDKEDLTTQLTKYSSIPMKIGTFRFTESAFIYNL